MNPRARRHIAILQYNLNKNRETTESVLNDKSTSNYAVLLLQEQYWSKYTKSSPLHHSWTLIEPPAHEPHQPKAIIYVNNTLLPPNTYEPVIFPTSNAIGIAIKLQDNSQLLAVNIYNAQQNSPINTVFQYIQTHLSIRTYSMVLIAGDFNLHHPL